MSSPYNSHQPAPSPLSETQSDRVFQAPWEAKAFAIVNQLAVTEQCTWTEWTDQLAHEISTRESASADKSSYYERWVSACEKILIAKGLLDSDTIDRKMEEIIAEKEALISQE